jgi:hypothetical protein
MPLKKNREKKEEKIMKIRSSKELLSMVWGRR